MKSNIFTAPNNVPEDIQFPERKDFLELPTDQVKTKLYSCADAGIGIRDKSRTSLFLKYNTPDSGFLKHVSRFPPSMYKLFIGQSKEMSESWPQKQVEIQKTLENFLMGNMEASLRALHPNDFFLFLYLMVTDNMALSVYIVMAYEYSLENQSSIESGLFIKDLEITRASERVSFINGRPITRTAARLKCPYGYFSRETVSTLKGSSFEDVNSSYKLQHIGEHMLEMISRVTDERNCMDFYNEVAIRFTQAEKTMRDRKRRTIRSGA